MVLFCGGVLWWRYKVQFLKIAIVDFKSGVMLGVAGDGGGASYALPTT